MLTLYRDPDPAADNFAWDVCGAESNVALYCAALRLSSAWVSRLDAGMAGSLVHDAVAAGGVDTSLVELCEDAPTGLMLRDTPERNQRVQYYRRDSAASLMSPETVPIETCLDARAVHLTGITLALSDGCRDLVRALLSEPASALRSFDVNWRPALWPDGPPGELFEEAANLADIVFVGLDEAAAVWGFSEPSQVRSALPRPRIVVVKDGAVGVHTFTPDGEHFEPALRGPIAGPRGAGDAFAAGFLCGYLTHPTDLQRCQRLGHVVAMSAMTSELDVGPLPDASAIDAMLEVDPQEWSELVYPGADRA
ncbi:MAG: sugar kinase [Acidimicrobiia bacterium]|nr:sugar kinase [Acidimicrobiia bacterium]